MEIVITDGLAGKKIAEIDGWYGVEITNRKRLEELTAEANDRLKTSPYERVISWLLDEMGVGNPWKQMLMRSYHGGKIVLDDGWELEDE